MEKQRSVERWICIVSVWIACIYLPITVLAQEEEFRLNVSRNYGFSSGSQIRGVFTVDLIGDGNVTSVSFEMDGKEMVKIKEPPFSYKFNTNDYTLGWHDLNATLYLADGRKVITRSRRYEFVSADFESAAVQRILLPLFGGVFAIVIIGLSIQFLALRNKPKTNLPLGVRRKYGISGGSICPKCGRPFSLHWWGMNLITHKYDRCEFCGNWSIVKP